MNEAAIKGTFSDFRIIKGRKMAQLIVELPLEEADEALTILGGLPRPDSTRWVALARLASGAAEPRATGGTGHPARAPEDPTLKRERTPAERAWFLCTLPEFQQWIWEIDYGQPERTEGGAAEWLRNRCGVTSRAQITTNPDAHAAFKRIEDAFHRRNDPPAVPQEDR